MAFNESSLVQFKCLNFFGITDLSSDLVLHVFVRFSVLETLVLVSEAELLQAVDLALETPVVWCGDSACELTVFCLEKCSIKNVLSLAFSKLSLEECLAMLSKSKFALVFIKMVTYSLATKSVASCVYAPVTLKSRAILFAHHVLIQSLC